MHLIRSNSSDDRCSYRSSSSNCRRCSSNSRTRGVEFVGGWDVKKVETKWKGLGLLLGLSHFVMMS